MLNKLGLIVGIIFSVSLIFVSPVEAKVILKETGTVTIPAGEVINDDMFIGAENVDINGTINGDVFVGAGNVTVGGKIAGGLYVIAGQIQLQPTASIGGSLLVGSGNVDNQAAVGRHFFAGAGNIDLDAPVGGEARFGAGRLMLGPKAIVGGDLTYAAEDLEQDDLAIIKGMVRRHELPERQQWEKRDWHKAKYAMTVLSFLGSLLVGLTLLWLLNKPIQAIGDKIVTKFGVSLGWGLVLLFVTPPALLLLLITGIGAPLAFIGGMLFVIDLYLAKIFASLALGKVLAKQFNWKFSPVMALTVGLSAYYILHQIPVVSFFTQVLALLVGLGGLWLYKKQLLAKK